MELDSLPADDVRQKIGVVSQSSYFFNASIKDNLRLARPSAGDAEIERAVRQAGIHDFIEAFPKGVDTWVGEHGMRLSGGERRRLALARAPLKDAPIIILDEPTANLDALAARKTMKYLRALVSGRTIILITHRLVELDWADEVLVLDRGRVVERGSHQALMECDGLYRKHYDTGRGEIALETMLLEE